MKSRVEFGLLGPFELRVAGRPIPVSSPKHRILLAALLVEPGRLVSIAELVEAVWGAARPDNPRRALQLYVTRARSSLLDAGAPSLIATGVDGYRADVAAHSVDVKRFHDLLAQAHRAAEGAERAAEREALAAATGLWRGDAFVDVPSDLLHREYGHHLGEQRLRALERRIDISLREGRHVDAVDELVTLTAQHPLREKLWGQLITALVGSGRRADAVNTYHVMRRRLVEELGIEPGLDLQELYAQTLAGSGSTGTGVTALPPVPRQLPAEVIGFTGRAAEVAQMGAVLEEHEAVTCRSTVAVVTGMAGVGKTALAVHWCRRVADRFPDGQLWVDLRGFHYRAAVDLEQALTYVLRALDVRGRDMPPDADSKMALYRTLMDGRRMLVVLDNAMSVDQVRPLIPGGAGSFVLVTSRGELTGLLAMEGARAIQLEPFSTHGARQMLAHRIGSHRIDAEPAAVDRIIGKCGGLPIALAIVAARAVARPRLSLTALDQQLADAHDRLDNFTIPDGGADLRAVFSWSYRALAPAAAALFRYLGLHPTTHLSTAAAASLIGAPTAATRPLLDELVTAHLLVEHGPDRYAVHDLLHAYATELVTRGEIPEQRLAVQRRLLEWLARTAFNARPLMQPSESDVVPQGAVRGIAPLTFSSERHAREWYEAERHNLIAGVRLAYAQGFDDLCWRLAYASWIYLHLACAWNDVLLTHELGLRAAERSEDRRGQAHMLTELGCAHRATGRGTLAVDTHRKALAIFVEMADPMGTATALSNLGAAYRDAGMFDEALACSRQAYEADRIRGELGNMAISLYQTGLTLTAAGRAAEAIPVISEALELFRAIGRRRGETKALHALATAHTHLGQHADAIAHCQVAADIQREDGDRRYQATMLGALGDALRESGRVRESHDAFRRALIIFDDLGAPEAAALRVMLNEADR